MKISFTIRFDSNSYNFKNFFYFLHQYWEIINKRGVEYSGLHVTVATSFIFDILRIESEENNWDIEELKHLCLSLDNLCEKLNRNNFTYCQYTYLDHLKNYHLENNNNIINNNNNNNNNNNG